MKTKNQSSKLIQIIFIIALIMILISIYTFSNPVEVSKINYEPDSSYAAYFPLKVGNSYTYLVTHSSWPPVPPSKFRAVITKDTFINSKKYFYCKNFPFIGTGWVRYDTVSSNLLKYTPGQSCSIYQNHVIIDSFKSKINNQINCNFGTSSMRKCLDTVIYSVMNIYSRKSILYLHDGLIYEKTRYAKDFGIVYDCTGEPPPCSNYADLTGCVLNGVVYGDTTLTFIKPVNNNIPDKSSLEQNYPNPFNQSTMFKFQCSMAGRVKVNVFDISGKEIAILVNEDLNPGIYEVRFDSGDLPSGIYLYTLFADGIKMDKRKMILIK